MSAQLVDLVMKPPEIVRTRQGGSAKVPGIILGPTKP
jgi:hypothetical protein